MAVNHDGLAQRWPQRGVPDPFDRPIQQPERGPATADAAGPQRVGVDVNTLGFAKALVGVTAPVGAAYVLSVS
jgi:hypothetical protein